MKNILLLIIVIASTKLSAQVVSYDFYSFRLNNMYNVNPAYSGKGEGINAILNAQAQSNGVVNANKNLMLGVYSKVSNAQAIGGRVISDTRGAFQTLKADFSFAQILKLNDNSNLVLGISPGILNNNLVRSRIENYDMLDQTDPKLNQNFYNNTQFSLGAGLYYNFKELEVSVSMPHAVVTNQKINGYLNAALFYTIKAGDKFKVTPWVCYQNMQVTKSITSAYVKTMYAEKIWLQLGYQTNNSLQAMLGVNLDNFGLGYGFKLSNNNYKNVTSGAHEIMLSYKIMKQK